MIPSAVNRLLQSEQLALLKEIGNNILGEAPPPPTNSPTRQPSTQPPVGAEQRDPATRAEGTTAPQSVSESVSSDGVPTDHALQEEAASARAPEPEASRSLVGLRPPAAASSHLPAMAAAFTGLSEAMRAFTGAEAANGAGELAQPPAETRDAPAAAQQRAATYGGSLFAGTQAPESRQARVKTDAASRSVATDTSGDPASSAFPSQRREDVSSAAPGFEGPFATGAPSSLDAAPLPNPGEGPRTVEDGTAPTVANRTDDSAMEATPLAGDRYSAWPETPAGPPFMATAENADARGFSTIVAEQEAALARDSAMQGESTAALLADRPGGAVSQDVSAQELTGASASLASTDDPPRAEVDHLRGMETKPEVPSESDSSFPLESRQDSALAKAMLETPADAGSTSASLPALSADGQAAMIDNGLAALGLAGMDAAMSSQPERAGVIASFILNAHFLPGWPPPRPIEGTAMGKLAEQLQALPVAPKLTQDEVEMLLYLASLGLLPEQLARLLKLAGTARLRRKLLDALAMFLTNLRAVLAALKEEAESLVEEFAGEDPSAVLARAGKRRARFALR